MRGWVLAGGAAFVAAVIAAAVVTMIARGASPPSDVGAPSATSPATRGSTPAPDRGWLGAEVRNWPAGGVVIDAVVRGAPADTSGLLPGDVIFGVGNVSVTSTSELTAALTRLRPGQVVSIRARRGPASFTAQVALVARPRGRWVP